MLSPNYLLIGLSYDTDHGNFVWSDNTPNDYQAWDYNELEDGNGEYCVIYGLDNGAVWDTTWCWGIYNFVCKKSPIISL